MRLRQARKTVLTEMCSDCGLPVNSGARGSLTGWIFQEKRCRCQPAAGVDQDPAKVSTSDQYEVLSTLGEGGMGTVYCVLDKALNKTFAMKVLRKELSADREIAKRFEREATAAQSLNHPNLVSVYAHGINPDGSPFLIMDLVEGETLAERIKRVGELPPNEAIDIFIQVADAVAHAHERGILHRDLKPSNIMITSDEIGHTLVKVVDLGIAKVLPTSGRDTLNLTRTGEIFGSPLYMSPEQCQAKPVDARCDIYSMGCVMYESLTGHPPFEDTNPVKIILAHMYETPLPIRSNLINEGLQAAVMSCLQKLPENRYYQSMDALLRDLQTIKDGKRPLVELHTGKQRKTASVRRFLTLITVPIVLILLCFSFYLKDDIQLAINIISGKGTNPEDFVLSSRTSEYNRPFFLLEDADISRTLSRSESDKKTLEAISIFEKRSDYQNLAYACEQFLNRPTEDQRLTTSEVIEMLLRAHSQTKPTPSKGAGVFAIFSPPLLTRPLLGTSIVRIAGNYENQGRHEDAQKLYDLSLEWGEKFKQRYPWLLSESLLRYSQFLKLRHEDEKSAQLLMRAFKDAVTLSNEPVSVLHIERSRIETLSMTGYEFLRRGDIANARRAFQLDDYPLGIAVTDALSNPSRPPDIRKQVDDLGDARLRSKVDWFCENLDYQTIHAVFEMVLPAIESIVDSQKGNIFSSFDWVDLGTYQARYAFYLSLSGHFEEADNRLQKCVRVFGKRLYGQPGLVRDIYQTYLLEGDIIKANTALELKKEHSVEVANKNMNDSKQANWSPWDAEAVKWDQHQIDILSAFNQSYAECAKTIPDRVEILASKLLDEGKPLRAVALLEKRLESMNLSTNQKGMRRWTTTEGLKKAIVKVDVLRRLSHCYCKAQMYDRAVDTMKDAIELNTDSRITQARMLQELSEILASRGDKKASQVARDSSENLLSTVTRSAITNHIIDSKLLWCQNLDLAEYRWTKDLYKVTNY